LDINGDGWLDHVVLYQTSNTQIIKVISGNPASSSVVLSQYSYNEIQEGGSSFNDQYLISFSVENGGDIEGTGKDILIISKVFGMLYGFSTGMRGSSIVYLKENSQIAKEWILMPFERPNWGPDGVFTTFEVMKSIGDLNDDNLPEMFVSRKEKIVIPSQYGYSYSESQVYEIMDMKNQKIIYKFSIPVEKIVPMVNSQGDISEFLASVGTILISVNNNFQVKFKDLSMDQIMDSSAFIVQWEPSIQGNVKYQFFVNDASYGETTSTNQRVSLSPGNKTLKIIMYDEEGLIYAVDTVSINVPPNQTMLIITIAMISALIAVAVVFKVLKKKKMKQVLIEERTEPKEVFSND
jgi:hypothetical protein